MSISILLAEKIAQLFLILLMGYLVVRVGLLKPEDSRVLSVIMVYLVMPCMILNAFQIDNTPEVRTGIAYSFVVAGIMHLLFLALTALLKKPLKLDVIERCAVIYSNASALVIPLLEATLGSEYVVYSCGFIIVQLVLLWTHCCTVLRGDKGIDLKKIVTNLNLIAIVAAALAVCIVASRVPMKSLTRGLKPVYVIVAFTAVMNIFFTGGTAVGEGWLLGHITYEGLTAAIYMVLRIVMLIMGTFLLTYTTSPIALTDGLENLLGPLKKLHLPVHELAMMMSIALRFIPTLIEETDKIMSAQKARGADFESGNIFQRAKALVPILVPLFISAFRRADELATAMECRCYHGGQGRTALHVLRYQAADFVVLAAFVALATGLIVLKHMGI